MAYSNAWSETSYPGSTQARDIDDKARLTSLAIKERMETFLVKDWSADPVEPQDGISGKTDGKRLTIGCERFRELNGTLKACELNPNFLAIFRGSARVLASFHLPGGARLTAIEILANRGSVTNYTFRLIAVAFATTIVETIVATNTVATAGLSVYAQAIVHTISPNALYYVDIDTAGAVDTNSMLLYGVRLTYDVDSSQITV